MDKADRFTQNHATSEALAQTEIATAKYNSVALGYKVIQSQIDEIYRLGTILQKDAVEYSKKLSELNDNIDENGDGQQFGADYDKFAAAAIKLASLYKNFDIAWVDPQVNNPQNYGHLNKLMHEFLKAYKVWLKSIDKLNADYADKYPDE